MRWPSLLTTYDSCLLGSQSQNPSLRTWQTATHAATCFPGVVSCQCHIHYTTLARVIQAISAVDLLQVQYAKQDQAIAEIVRKLPPLKTSFPEDLFYPFTNDATSTQVLPVCALLLVALLSLFM